MIKSIFLQRHDVRIRVVHARVLVYDRDRMWLTSAMFNSSSSRSDRSLVPRCGHLPVLERQHSRRRGVRVPAEWNLESRLTGMRRTAWLHHSTTFGVASL